MDKQASKKIWTPNTYLRHHIPALVLMAVLLVFISWVLGGVLASTVFEKQEESKTSSLNIGALDSSVSDMFAYTGENGKVLAAQTSNNDPHITAVPGQTIQQRYVLKDGEVKPIFIFNTQYPKFIGETNLKNVSIYLDIYGTDHVTGNTKIDSNGNWEWQASVPIQPGTYMFNVRAVDPETREELAKDSSMIFEVVLGKSDTIQKVDLNNTPQLNNNGTLFDIRVNIPPESKTIKPGDDLPADLRLVNIGTPTQSVDVEVQYTIRNEEDEIVSEQSETVAVKKELTYSKKFYTSGSLPDGNYKLTVAIPSKDLIATASDVFKIESNLSANSSTTKKSGLPINNVIIQIVGATVFLGILIGYMEYTKVTTLACKIRKPSGPEVLN